MAIDLKDFKFTVEWSKDDNEFVATCTNLEPYMSCLDQHPVGALDGLILALDPSNDDLDDDIFDEDTQPGTCGCYSIDCGICFPEEKE